MNTANCVNIKDRIHKKFLYSKLPYYSYKGEIIRLSKAYIENDDDQYTNLINLINKFNGTLIIMGNPPDFNVYKDDKGFYLISNLQQYEIRSL